MEDILFRGINHPRFKSYHRRNPQVYEKFRETALETRRKGFRHYSAKGIFEIIRWHTTVQGSGPFKVCNDYTPLYARMLMNELPEVDGFFRTKKSKADLPAPATPRKKLMVCGHGRHGKDTLCEFLREKGYTFVSSSRVAADFVFGELKEKYGYRTVEECWEDRFNHRPEWYRIISAYNQEDPAALARKIYEQYDIYCGIRNPVEFLKARADGLFELSVWVDASRRLPPEGEASNGITPDMCDLVLDNNGTLEEFQEKMEHFYTEYLCDTKPVAA